MQAKTVLFCLTQLIFNFLFQFTPVTSSAQAPLFKESAFQRLTAQEGAALTLELDLTELINNKNTNQYFPGTLTTAEGKVLKMEARARGKYRRKICEMPPLKLKFSKKELRATGLDTLNEVKLVVPCSEDPDGEQRVLREYVAYRMFERLSPESHVRARLVKVAFRDRHVEKLSTPVWCLLVEHEEEVVARQHSTLVESYNLPADSLYTEQVGLNALFQYMIGNTDWNLPSFRNIYLLRPSTGERIRPLPFDFDFSGFVNADYATPTSTTGLKNVQERLLMADGIPQSALLKAAAHIEAAKEDLLALCSAPFLNKSTSKEMTRYLESYFESVGKELQRQQKAKGSLR